MATAPLRRENRAALQQSLTERERQHLLSVWLLLIFIFGACLKDSGSVMQNGVILGIAMGVVGFYWALHQPQRVRRRVAAPRPLAQRPVPAFSMSGQFLPGRGAV